MQGLMTCPSGVGMHGIARCMENMLAGLGLVDKGNECSALEVDKGSRRSSEPLKDVLFDVFPVNLVQR